MVSAQSPKYTIATSKRVFTIYVGLIAGGYDLMDTRISHGIPDLVQAIRTAQLPDSVISYFRKASLDKCKVNPYWPNAYLLTVASFHISESEPYKYRNFSLLLEHINSLDSVSPSDKDILTMQWISELPTAYTAVATNCAFCRLWDMYMDCIDLSRCESIIQDAISATAQLAGLAQSYLPDLAIIPNPLQAPELTDTVTLKDRFYLIKAVPDKSSCVHEILHHVFSPILSSNRELVKAYSDLLKEVYQEMLQLQYAWDESEDSWFRVFEEHLVRAAEIWINYDNDFMGANFTAKQQTSLGFKYIPAITKEFQTQWRGCSNAAQFIARCLDSCRSQV